MRTHQLSVMPSEYRFGLLFTTIFAFLAGYGYFLKGWGASITVFFVVMALLFGVLTFITPRLLVPLNKIWFLLGELLGKVMSPIVLGIIFFGVLTPVGLISRMCGRDELRLKKQPVDSAWIERTATSPIGDMFKNQF